MLHPWAASLMCLACCLPHLGFCQVRHLDGWLRSWLPLSVFIAGGGRGSVDCLVFNCFGL